MNETELQKHADALRATAKRNAHALLKIPEGCSSESVNNMVDSIISCAIMEITIIHRRATKETHDLYRRLPIPKQDD